jgi:TolB-like protein/class 3 adenylate cyclase
MVADFSLSCYTMLETRQLAAIIFTDIVGYTALMGSDEDKAFEVLKKNHAIHENLINKYKGRLIKEIGDGTLASFPLASDAVRCAMEIQKEAKDQDIPLKIGIHQGEMVMAGTDVLGDGVNIASRLQEVSQKGRITISGKVYSDIHNKAGIKTKYIGEKKLKNVDDRVKVYEVLHQENPIKDETIKGEESPKGGKKIAYYIIIGIVVMIAVMMIWKFLFIKDKASQSNEVTIEELDKSIAVLPFANMSDDPEQQYFSDGIMEAILNHLTKIKELKVISRTSVMQYRNTEKTSPKIGEELGVSYLLEGGVQTFEGKVRINVQLIDAVKDKHVWSENYDRELTDIFAIQSEIAQKIATELSTVLTPREREEIQIKGTDNLEAYNLYLMGRYFWYSRTEDGLKKSVDYFEQAVAKDSQYALAYSGLADAYLILVAYGYLPMDEGHPKAKEQALKALEIDPNLAETHATLGTMARREWRWKEAETELKQSIELNPNYAIARHWYAEYLEILGQYEEAREQVNRGLEIDPLSFLLRMQSGAFYYNNGDLDKALKENQKVLELNKNQTITYWKNFVIYREQGRDEEAFLQLKEFWSRDSSRMEYKEVAEDIYTDTGIDGVYKWWIDLEASRSTNPVFIAMNYALLVENELALDWLAKTSAPYLKVNRVYNESLRSDPRFQAMLKKNRSLMGLED